MKFVITLLVSVLGASTSALALDMHCEGTNDSTPGGAAHEVSTEYRLNVSLLSLESAPRMLISLRTAERHLDGMTVVKTVPVASLQNGVAGARIFQSNGRVFFLSAEGGITSVSMASAVSLAASRGMMNLPVNTPMIPGLPTEASMDQLYCVAF